MSVAGDAVGGLELRYVDAADGLLASDASALRNDVLIVPFGLAPIEWDDSDAAFRHLLALESGRVVGYARLILELERSSARIRQVSVAEDRQRVGVGTAMMLELLEHSRRLGLRRVWLEARLPAIPFYERLGFEVTSDVFIVGSVNLPHVTMEARLAE